MATSVIFDLVDELVTRFDAALATVKVIDGDTVDGEYGDFLMVGWDDPDNDRAVAGEGQQSWAGLGHAARDEAGTITCLALSWRGDNDINAVRAAVKATTVAVEDLLRSDPNLSGAVPGLQWTGYGTRTELKQWLADTGAVATCTFDIAYKARI